MTYFHVTDKVKRSLKVSILLICILSMLLSLSACSGETPKTLESVVSNNSSIKDEIDSFILNNDNLKGYDKISISGNTIYADIYQDEEMYNAMTDKSVWDFMKETLDKEVMGSQVDNVSSFISQLEEKTGVEGIQLTTRLIRESNEEAYYSYTFSTQE